MEIKITWTGITPLLMHKFSDEAQLAMSAGSRSSSSARDFGTPREQAEKAIYRDEGGNIIVPQMNIMATIREAGRFFKVGKRQITTQKSSIIPGCLDIPGLAFKLQYRDPWEVDSRIGRLPGSGIPMVCHRPLFHDWAVSFTCELDTTIINAKFLREIIDASGKRIGLCAFRPDKKGPFGKFVVTAWEQDENGK